MLELLNEVLDLVKLRSGAIDIELVPFDLRQTIESVRRAVQPRAVEDGLDLIVEYDTSLAGRVVGDPLRLRQVLLILAATAVRSTAEGQVAIRVMDRGRVGGNQVVEFRVEDGSGGTRNSPPQQSSISVDRTEPASSDRFGADVGLTLSQRLVQLMGGALDGADARGVAFRFVLPLAVCASQAEADSSQPGAHGDALVVHSDAERRHFLATQLAALGLRVHAASNAGKAFALLDAELAGSGVRLALVDYVLADIDGETLAHALVRRGVVPAGAVVLERPAGVRLDLERLRRRGIGALHGQAEDPTLCEVLQRLTDADTQPRERAATVSNAAAPDPSFERSRTRSAAARASQPAPAAALDVLVVEDNLVNQKVITHLLGKLGCCVDVAEHGLRALEMVQSKCYSIIFMDCQMPQMDGYAATAQIRRLAHPACGTPIVALTANAMAGDREKCLDCGMNDYLSKPATAQQIHGMLAKWAVGSPQLGG
jgi:CheY-like chemotaxis protein